METIVKALVQKRKEQGITQKSLAKRLGIAQATLSEFENEKTVPRLDTLERFASELGLEIQFALHQKNR